MGRYKDEDVEALVDWLKATVLWGEDIRRDQSRFLQPFLPDPDEELVEKMRSVIQDHVFIDRQIRTPKDIYAPALANHLLAIIKEAGYHK